GSHFAMASASRNARYTRSGFARNTRWSRTVPVVMIFVPFGCWEKVELRCVCAILRSGLGERTKHDVRIDVASLGVAKCGWKSTDNFEPKLLPQENRWCIRRNDKIELHCTKSQATRLD